MQATAKTKVRRSAAVAPKEARAPVQADKPMPWNYPDLYKPMPWNSPDLPPVLRLRLHREMFAWGMAANAQPAPVLSSVAVVLHVLHRLVEKRDTAGLAALERSARKLIRRPAGKERAQQAVYLAEQMLQGLDLSEKLDLGSRAETLARRFVTLVGVDHSMPITRELRSKGLLSLVVPDEAAIAKVSRVFGEALSATDANSPDGEKLVTAGLRGLGYQDRRGLYSFAEKRLKRDAARR